MIRYDEAKEFIKIGIINGYNYPLLKKKNLWIFLKWHEKEIHLKWIE